MVLILIVCLTDRQVCHLDQVTLSRKLLQVCCDVCIDLLCLLCLLIMFRKLVKSSTFYAVVKMNV